MVKSGVWQRWKFGVLSLVLLMLPASVLAESGAKDIEIKTRPFEPSYIITEGDHRKLKPSDWADPKVCGQCHTRQYEGWNGSMHSNAFKDPVFQALWALAEKANPENRNHCGACHSPIGTVTETITFHPDKGLHGEFTAPDVAAQGVSCDVCHTITGSTIHDTAVLEHGNASFVMSPGEVKYATLDDPQSPYHKAEKSEIHGKSDFCGNCHNIFHPGNNFPIERTYDEWKYSIYAQNDIQCQDCHMVPVDVAIRVADELKRPEELNDPSLEGFAGLGGKMRKVIHKHGFVGGNAVVTDVVNSALNPDENAEHFGRNTNKEEAIKRLQSAAELKHYLKQQSGPLHKLKVKVINKRAGHHLPTSLTEVRQVWVEVVISDDQGNELYRNGTLSEANEVPANAVIFNAHAVDKDGNDTMLPWEITRFVDVNTIPPKGYKYAKYAFNIPEGTKQVTVTSKLHYRSFSQGMADLLLGKGKITVPSVEMVSLTETFDVGALKVAKADKH